MLTVKEIAKSKCVTTETVRTWITKGLGKVGQKVRLKAEKVKHGARTEYRVSNADLEEFAKMFLT